MKKYTPVAVIAAILLWGRLLGALMPQSGWRWFLWLLGIAVVTFVYEMVHNRIPDIKEPAPEVCSDCGSETSVDGMGRCHC